MAGPSFQKLIVPLLLGLGILSTLGREIVFANFLGTARELEIFRLAFALPNMLSQSLASAYIGALLPLLVSAEQGSANGFNEFRRKLTRVSVAVILLITAIGVLSVMPQSAALAPGLDSDSRQILSSALILCWGFFLLTGLSFVPRLFLNNRQEFWPGVSTSLVISSCLIVICLVAAARLKVINANLLSTTTVVAGGLILILHLMREPRSALLLFGSATHDRGHGPYRAAIILKPLSLVLLLHLINALPRFVDRAFATGFPQGIVAALDYSYNILTVPGILLGTTVITMFYPAFVRRVQDKNQADLHRSIAFPVLGALFIALIVGLALHFFATEIVTLVYVRGAFGIAATQSTATLLAWHGLGLGFMVSAMVLTQACMAYGVFAILLAIAAARILAKTISIMWLVPRYGLDGLGASFLVPEFVSTLLLIVLLFFLNRRNNTA